MGNSPVGRDGFIHLDFCLSKVSICLCKGLQMWHYFIEILIFLFGLCIGSFLNVCIYRLPVSKSIVRPRSLCPACGTFIAYYDNIPLFSYLWLHGRCRHCGIRISWRYPIVELLGGLFALGTYLKFGLTIEALIYFAFIASLLVITFIDLDHRIIPDAITLPGIPIFFVASFALPAITISESLLGILVGGGSLFLVAWLYHLFTRKEGMGGGDIKLLAMMGALVGWQGVFFTIFVSSLVGTLAGFAVMLQSRQGMKLAVPFGPFLSIGSIIYIFFGNQLVSGYLKLLR
jgi:leader peptidase (prepilin peptidase) / N-methyltransferase